MGRDYDRYFIGREIVKNRIIHLYLIFSVCVSRMIEEAGRKGNVMADRKQIFTDMSEFHLPCDLWHYCKCSYRCAFEWEVTNVWHWFFRDAELWHHPAVHVPHRMQAQIHSEEMQLWVFYFKTCIFIVWNFKNKLSLNENLVWKVWNVF